MSMTSKIAKKPVKFHKKSSDSIVSPKTSKMAPSGLSKSQAMLRITSDDWTENSDPNEAEHKSKIPVSPLDFDAFYPWVCGFMGLIEKIFVIRDRREEYVPVKKRLDKKEKDKKPSETVLPAELLSIPSATVKSGFYTADVLIPVIAYYDSRNCLMELIIRRGHHLTQKHIKVMNVFLPFHSTLTRVAITKCRLLPEIIYELAQILTIVNITEVCLDGTYCKECNYYCLLDNANNLKHLSLNRCRINDTVIEEIFKRILAKGSKAPKILELSSNSITDKGASEIGKTLRTNRTLLHLNLAGNRISDVGAHFILNALMKFPLTKSEVIDTNKKKVNYFKNRINVFKRCYEDQSRRQLYMESRTKELFSPKRLLGVSETKKSKTLPKSEKSKVVYTIKELAASMTNQIIGGPFRDVYDNDHTTQTDNVMYCKGNFKLSSINLAYNCLEYPSMMKILQVMEYQSTSQIPLDCTGLVRIVLCGNYIPRECAEYSAIQILLNNKCANAAQKLR